MNKKLKTTLLGIAMASISWTAQAIPVGYSLSGDIVTSTSREVEWMQWDVFVDTSPTDALNAYAASGWQLASTRQMADLFTDWFGSTWSYSESEMQTLNLGFSPGPDVADEFLAAFGVIQDGGCPTSDAPCGTASRLAAVYGTDHVTNPRLKLAVVRTDFLRADGSKGFAMAQLQDAAYSMSTASDQYGVALTRSTAPTPVPEPAPMALMGLGLLGVAISRRRQKQS